jgi:hypothetical protein
MNAKIENGNLVITIPLNSTPVPSKSAKTLLVASTHGSAPTAAVVNGKPVTVSLNAYIKP